MKKNAAAKLRRTAIGFAVLFVIVALSAPLWLRALLLNDKVAERIKARIESAATEALGQPLEVGAVRFDLWGRARATGIKLGSGDNAILQGGDLRVSLDWAALARNPAAPESAISSIRISGPVIFVHRDEQGKWNYPQPEAQPPREGPVYPRLSVEVSNADLRFRDDFATPALYLRDAAARGLNASIEIHPSGRIAIKAHSSDSSVCADLSAAVDFNAQTGFTIGGKCSGAAAGVTSRVAELYGVTVSGGRPMNVAFSAGARYRGIGKMPDYTYSASFDFSDKAVAVPAYDLHFTDARGSFTYANGRLRFDDVSAAFAGGRIRAQAALVTGKTPDLALRAEAEAVDIARAGAWVRDHLGERASGVVTGWFFASGDPASPEITAEFQARAPRWNDYHADSAQALVSVRGGAVEVSRASMALNGARARASGLVLLNSENEISEYSVSATFEDANLDAVRGMLPFEVPRAARGVVSGRVFAVKPEDESTPRIAGSISVPDLAYGALGNLQGSASFSMERGDLHIENAAVNGSAGYAALTGVASAGGALDLHLSGAQADIGALLTLADRRDIRASGALRFSGDITGTGGAPAFAGRVSGGALSAAALSVDKLDGGLRYAGRTVTLEDLAISAGEGHALVRGRIAADGSLLDLDADARDMSLPQILDAGARFAGSAPPDIPGLAGKLSAQVRVTGKASQPRAHAQLTVTNASAYGERINSARAELDYDGGLRVHGGLLQTASSRVAFSGEMSAKKQLDFRFDSAAFAVADLKAAPEYEAGGMVSFKGTVTGAADDPLVSVFVTSPDLRVRTLEFRMDRAAQITYNKGLLTFRDAELHSGGGRYTLAGAYQGENRRLTARMTFSNASPDAAAALIRRPLPQGTSGAFHGDVTLMAVGDMVSADIEIHGRDASVGTYPLTNMDLKGKYSGTEFLVEDFSAENEVSRFAANGMINLERPEASLLNFDATRVDLAMLHSIGAIPGPASGTMDIFVDVAEDEGRRYLAGSLHAYDLSAMGVSFEQSRGFFEFNGSTLTLTQLQLIQDRQRVILRGDIPAPLGDKTADAHPLQLVLSTQNFRLETLNPVLARWGLSLEGNIDVEDIVFRDQDGKPHLSGAAMLRGVTLKHADLHQPIENINGALRADGGRLAIEDMAGTMSGKEIRLEGGVSFEGTEPDFVLELRDVDDLYVGYKNIYKGRVDIRNLRIQGNMKGASFDPLKGATTVTLHDGTFTLVPLGENAESATATFPFSVPGNNLVIEAGENFAARTPGNTVHIQPAGTLRIGGDLAQPDLRGYFSADDGYVKVPVLGLKFKLVEEAVIGFHNIEGIGLVPFLVASATARTAGMDLTVDISGPLLDLNLYPEYQRQCAAEAGEQAGAAVLAVSSGAAGGGAGVPIGGGYTAPVCPSFKFSGTDKNGAPITNDQVFARITRPGEQDQEQGSWTTIAQNSLLSWGTGLGSEFITEKSPIDEFELSLDPNKDIFIQLEKCVDRKFCLRYERLFSEAEEAQIEILYKFRKRSYLIWGIDEENEPAYEIEYRLNF